MNRLSYTLLSTPGRVPVVGLRLLSTSDPACNRPNIRHPRHPNFPRLKLLTLAEPKFSVKHETTEKLWQDCPLEREKRLKKERAAPNEWERLYAEELRNHLEASKMTGIFHTNYIKHKQRHEAWQNARRVNMELKSYPMSIGKAVCQEPGSRWKNLLHFWIPVGMFQYFTFSPEVNADALLKLDRKIPDLMLLGAIVEGQFLKKKQLQDLAKMPSLDGLRGELCSILQMSARKTSSLLSRNQQQLSQNLEQYVKDQTPKDS